MASSGWWLASHDFPLMVAVEALPLWLTDEGQRATTQHGFSAFDLLPCLGRGHTEADIDAPTLLAGRADKQPRGYMAGAR